MLSFGQIWTDIGLLFLFCFPLGYLLLHLKKKSEFFRLNFFVRLPVYVAVGMAGYVVVLSALNYLRVDIYTLVALSVFFWFLLVLKNKRYAELRQHLSVSRGFIDFDHIIPVTLLLFSLFIFIRIAHDWGGWPPPGDAVTHAIHVSLFVQSQGYNTLGVPFWDTFVSIWGYYPKGFHVSGAATSILTGRYPPEAILILATSISALIPSLVYSTIYLKTKNPFLSLTGSILTYLVPSSAFLISRYVVFTYYTEGVYPSLFATLLVITSFFTSCLNDPHQGLKDQLKNFSVIAICGFAILLTYYSFLIFIILLAISRVVSSSIILKSTKPLTTKKLIIFVAGLSFGVFTYLLFHKDLGYFIQNLAVIRELRYLDNYWIPVSFLFSKINGALILLAFIFSFSCLAWRKYSLINIDYIVFVIPLLISSFSIEIYREHLWFLLPKRFIVPLTIFSFIVLAVSLQSMKKMVGRRLAYFKPITKATYFKLTAKLAYLMPTIILLLVTSNFLAYQRSSWGRPTDDDYDILVWIDRNIDSDDLILNDRSYLGLYLPSLSLKNVVFLRELQHDPSKETTEWDRILIDRLLECGQIWDNPNNTALIYYLVNKWQIRYIFVSSQSVYYDFWNTQKYQGSRYDSDQIMNFFDNNLDLYPVFKRDRAGVYSTFLASQREESTEFITSAETMSWWHQSLGIGEILTSTDHIDGSYSIEYTGKTLNETYFGVDYAPNTTLDLSDKDYIQFWLRVLNPNKVADVKFEIHDEEEKFLQYTLFVPPTNEWIQYRIQMNNPSASSGTTNLSKISSFKIFLIGAKEEAYTIRMDRIETGKYF